jgi:hypothetical protein
MCVCTLPMQGWLLPLPSTNGMAITVVLLSDGVIRRVGSGAPRSALTTQTADGDYPLTNGIVDGMNLLVSPLEEERHWESLYCFKRDEVKGGGAGRFRAHFTCSVTWVCSCSPRKTGTREQRREQMGTLWPPFLSYTVVSTCAWSGTCRTMGPGNA